MGYYVAQNESTCFPFSKDPWQAFPKPIHMFSLSRLLGDYEKCLSLEPALILVTHNERASHWLLDKVRVGINRSRLFHFGSKCFPSPPLCRWLKTQVQKGEADKDDNYSASQLCESFFLVLTSAPPGKTLVEVGIS